MQPWILYVQEVVSILLKEYIPKLNNTSWTYSSFFSGDLLQLLVAVYLVIMKYIYEKINSCVFLLYCMLKKSWRILYSYLLFKMGKDFLDIKYLISGLWKWNVNINILCSNKVYNLGFILFLLCGHLDIELIIPRNFNVYRRCTFGKICYSWEPISYP